MASKPSVLHVIHGLTTGGAEIDLFNKLAYLAAHHDCQTAICCLMRRGELADKFESHGIQIIGPMMKHRYDVSAAWALRRMLIAPQWDVVHTHLCATNLIVWAVRQTIPKRARKPMLAGEHAMAERWPAWVNMLNRRMAKTIYSFLVPSTAMAHSYIRRGINREHVTVLPNSVDVAEIPIAEQKRIRIEFRQKIGATADDFVIGTVCRLVAIKNLPLLFQAVARLPVRLYVVGDGPEQTNLAELIEQSGLQAQIRLLGRRSDVHEFLVACDLFVLSSRSESFGIAVGEALLMGVPVVSTNVGGISEITDNGSYAYLVEPDNVDALQEGIEWTIQNYTNAQEMAQRGQTFVETHYSIKSCAERLLELYRATGSTK